MSKRSMTYHSILFNTCRRGRKGRSDYRFSPPHTPPSVPVAVVMKVAMVTCDIYPVPWSPSKYVCLAPNDFKSCHCLLPSSEKNERDDNYSLKIKSKSGMIRIREDRN